MGGTSGFISRCSKRRRRRRPRRRAQQQRRFDRMRREFNTERPHEALGPAAAGAPLCRRRPGPTRRGSRTPWYDATHQVRRVEADGADQVAGRADLCERSGARRSGRPRRNRARRLDRPLHAGGTGAHRSADAPIYARVARPTDRLTGRAAQLWKWRPRGNHRTISTGAWKSRTEREIPTFPQADPSSEVTDEDEKRQTGTSTKCYPCIRSNLLPMFPVAHHAGAEAPAYVPPCRS